MIDDSKNKAALTPEDIQKLANLSQLEVSEGELEKFSKEFSGILDYVSELSEVEVEGAQIEGIAPVNVLRADESPHARGVYTEALLKSAPDSEKGFFKVRKIIQND